MPYVLMEVLEHPGPFRVLYSTGTFRIIWTLSQAFGTRVVPVSHVQFGHECPASFNSSTGPGHVAVHWNSLAAIFVVNV